MIRIQVFGHDELENRIKNNLKVFRNCISIADNDGLVSRMITRKFVNVLSLRFLDFEEKDVKNEDEIIFTREDLYKIVDFYNKNKSSLEFTIHCWAGISRSTAVAICMFYLYYKDEEKSISELFKIRPYARPNLHVLRIFDEYYHTNFGNKLKKINIDISKKITKNYFSKEESILESNIENYGLKCIEKFTLQGNEITVDVSVYELGKGLFVLIYDDMIRIEYLEKIKNKLFNKKKGTFIEVNKNITLKTIIINLFNTI